MQTFLPYPNFTQSAACLDRQRLGKQRVECLQILNTLTHGSRWINHPAVKMWKGSEHELIDYGLAVCAEWKQRGYQDTCAAKIAAFDTQYHVNRLGIRPSFIGNAEFHASHRAALLFKKPDWYSRFGWAEQAAVPNERGSLPYVWPVPLLGVQL